MLKPVEPEQRARTQVWPAELPLVHPDPGRIAVLLNKNARRVTDRVARRLANVVGNDHVFQTSSLDEAEAVSREVVQRGYGTIVSGGGDGTLMRLVNLVHRYIKEANNWRVERFRRYGETQALLANPRFAFLKLGTGNGVSHIVGSRGPVRDLQNIVDFIPGRTQTIPLIEQDDERFVFGGCGYDSQILDDYNSLKARAKNPLFKALMQNLTGYLMAVFGRTIPRMLLGRAEKVDARIVNRGRAYYLDPRRGDYVEEVAPGETLFEGRVRFVSAGTTPYYGYGFKAFPFARIMPGMMNLRVATLGPLRLVPWHVGSLWNGTYRNADGLFDFLVEDVEVELDRPATFQHSGDAQGLRDKLDLKIADDNLELVDLYRPRRTH